MSEQVVLNASEASRVDYVAKTLGLSREVLCIKVYQLKSFMADKKREVVEVVATLKQNVSENFSNATSLGKLAYGVSGIVSIAFAVKIGTGAVAVSLFLIGFFLLFIGLAELKRLLWDAWNSFTGQLDAAFS